MLHDTTFSYDAVPAFWRTSARGRLNNAAVGSEDLPGRRLAMTDPRGFGRRYPYRRLIRQISVGKPLRQAVRFKYANYANSNLVMVRHPA